jgi:hypothetical protein
MDSELEDWETWRRRVLERLSASLEKLILSSSEDGGFFVLRLASEADDLCDTLEHFLSRGEVFLRDAHSRSELILDSAFSGRPDDIFRGVHFAVDSRFMFSPVVSSWSERVDALLDQGRLREVRRLIVFSDSRELLNPAARRFLAIESERPGHSHRYVSEQTLREHLRAASLPAPHDFGIYGSRFVFTSASPEPSDLSGTWTRRPDLVRDYIQTFDRLWAVADEVPETQS